jgi:hypothetical protein
MTTQEGNKLIAEFEEFHKDIYDKWFKNSIFKGYNEADFKYHSSWDWLMPAISKWDHLSPLYSNDKYCDLCDELDRVVTNYDIVPTFEFFVICIQWYNQNKNL